MALKRRHSIVALSFAAVLICYLDRVSISVAVVPLQAELGWSATRTGTVLSAFFLGYVACQIPAGWAAQRIGPRLLLGFALLWWSLMTMLTPIAAHTSFAMLIAVRILMGVGEASMFPGAYALFANWVPAAERSRAVGLLFSAIPLGTLVALSASGLIGATLGWPWIFYIFGTIGIGFAMLWLFAVTDVPTSRKDAGQEWRAAIRPRVPWRALLSKVPVWALIINSFCTSWSIYVILAWTPLYLREVQHVSLASAGLFASLPWITMFLMTNLAAWSADMLIARGVDVTFVRKLMQVTGLSGAAIFLLAMPGATSAMSAALLLCGALGSNALTMSGFAPNHLDLTPRYASVLIGITNTAGTLPGIIGVFITGWMVDVTGNYDSAFYTAAIVSVCGAVVFLLFASGRPLKDLERPGKTLPGK